MRFAAGHRRWTALAAVLAVAAAAIAGPAAAPVLLLPVAVLLFFRDPDRSPDGDGVIAPADGRVTVLREEEGRVRLGVFMNLIDVHVNRAPVTGRVASREHRPGGHWPAFSKRSDRNERVEWRIECREDDAAFAVEQIAGTVARRITPYLDEGDAVERGQRLGVIAFGSRVDVVFPPRYGVDDLAVERGDAVRAGETVVAPPP